MINPKMVEAPLKHWIPDLSPESMTRFFDLLFENVSNQSRGVFPQTLIAHFCDDLDEDVLAETIKNDPRFKLISSYHKIRTGAILYITLKNGKVIEFKYESGASNDILPD